jgi:hypothetical protein
MVCSGSSLCEKSGAATEGFMSAHLKNNNMQGGSSKVNLILSMPANFDFHTAWVTSGPLPKICSKAALGPQRDIGR